MTSEDIYVRVSNALREVLDHKVIDTEDGIALIGKSASDVWPVVVKEASLEVTAP